MQHLFNDPCWYSFWTRGFNNTSGCQNSGCSYKQLIWCLFHRNLFYLKSDCFWSFNRGGIFSSLNKSTMNLSTKIEPESKLLPLPFLPLVSYETLACSSSIEKEKTFLPPRLLVFSIQNWQKMALLLVFHVPLLQDLEHRVVRPMGELFEVELVL